MDNRYEIVAGTADHAAQLAATMREADVREIWASGRLVPDQALKLSMLASRDTSVGLVNGAVACMFGIAQPTVLSDVGYPWLLGSDLIVEHARSFLRLSRAWVQERREGYSALANFVDVRNTEAVRWLKWLGFKMDEPVPFGPDQLPFHPFYWRRDHV